MQVLFKDFLLSMNMREILTTGVRTKSAGFQIIRSKTANGTERAALHKKITISNTYCVFYLT